MALCANFASFSKQMSNYKNVRTMKKAVFLSMVLAALTATAQTKGKFETHDRSSIH